LAHLPLRQLAPPQSESEPQDEFAAVAHLPLRQLMPWPQSESEPQDEGEASAIWKVKSVARTAKSLSMAAA
jgi:hypothetical protein